MTANHPPFTSIEHGPHFFELIFADFEPSTVEQWLQVSEGRYEAVRQAPWIRALADIREVRSFTPFIVAAFEKVITREYATSNLRVAFLISPQLFHSRIAHSTGEFYPLYRKARAISRYFRDRDRALDWLREGLPPGSDLTDPPRDSETTL